MSDVNPNLQTDISAKQQSFEESELLLNLYRALIENRDLGSGLRAAVKIVCEFTRWIVGTAWLPSKDETKIGLCSFWHQDDPKLAEFIVSCQHQQFARNVGILGRVWHRQKYEWTRNLAVEPTDSFPLAPAAANAGLKAAFALPIMHNHDVDAVLCFHAREAREEDGRLIEVISRIANQLGFALQHKGLEEELLQQQALVLRTHGNLEEEVERRTAELRLANQMLQAEVSGRELNERRMQERTRQQEALANLGRQALGGTDLSALMHTITELVATSLNVEFCKVLELLPGSDTLILRAGVGWKVGLVGRATVSAGTNSQAGYTLLCKEPVIVKDLPTEERFSGPPLLCDHGVISGLSVIIGQSDRPFGVLGAHTARARVFSQDDVHFLQAIANVFSQVIEHNLAIEELHRNATWLKRLIETTQDAVVSIDRRGCIVLFNAAAERVFGYRADEVVGRKVNDLMAEPYATEHDGYIARYEETGEPRAIGRIRSVEGRRKSGETFPLELSVTQVATGESEKVHYAAFIRDISEVRRGQAWLQSLIEATQDAVLSIDRRGRIALFNPAAERIFGYTRDEVIGQKVNMLMAEPYATEHDEYIARYEKTGEARAIGRIRSVTARRKDGEPFPIELSVTEIAMDQEVHYAAFIRDISEKTKLQGQLVESERLAAIGSTAAKIGHELANPLNGMSLTVQLLEQRITRLNLDAISQLTPTVKRLRDEISRLQKLAGEFATIARKEKYVFRPVNLMQLVDDVVKLQALHFARNGVEIQISLAEELPSISIDSDKMKQALLNLIKNSAEAMPRGGRIIFNAFVADGAVILEITDTGDGIPLDIDAFEPFLTTKREGTGVGLVIVRQILTAHNGKISYRSKPGEGTTFRIELPLTL
ncbi:MAG TPA: PAS domain S-box protein [Candidatus Limnocylindria bacterium]|nr:PAS domain S-box protein [Candidatus Limnocylindria bacterium]